MKQKKKESKTFRITRLSNEEVREKAREHDDPFLRVAAEMGINVVWFDELDEKKRRAKEKQ